MNLSEIRVVVEDRTSIWTVLEAIGVVGSFIVAVSLLGRELANRRQRTARHVVAWVELNPDWKPDRDDNRDLITVQNGADTPIYCCFVYAGWSRNPFSREFEFGIVPPHATRSATAWVSEGWAGSSESMLMDPEFRVVAEVAFSDADGRHWFRRADGKLFRLKHQPVPGLQPPKATLLMRSPSDSPPT